MRTFKDKQCQHWQVALMDASYGTIMLVFSSVHGDDVRRQLLEAHNLSEAVDRFNAMDDDALRAILAEAEIWDMHSGKLRDLWKL